MDYYTKLTEILKRYPSDITGNKYIKNWDLYLKEKQLIVERANLQGVKTCIDIGTGVGVLPYLLKQQGINVEGTDVDENITGSLFRECCELIQLTRHTLYIQNGVRTVLPKRYDMLFATRTSFDITCEGDFDWMYFVQNMFEYVDRIFVKMNRSTRKGIKITDYPRQLQPYMFEHQNVICFEIDKKS